MGNNYIPANNEEFDTFFKNILLYVTSRTIGASPAWTHIPAAAKTTLTAAYSAWEVAFAPTQRPHTLEFRKEDRGKTVYIAAAWQNERGNIGQWSDIQSAIIP
jgi:hypothetical protein